MQLVDPHPLVVIHDNGLHEVSVKYCNCLHASNLPRRKQLLRMGWYPATVHLPATCVSFEALNLFHAATLTGKVSAYSFYKTLIYMTDALGLRVPKVRNFAIIVPDLTHFLPETLSAISPSHSSVPTLVDVDEGRERQSEGWGVAGGAWRISRHLPCLSYSRSQSSTRLATARGPVSFAAHPLCLDYRTNIVRFLYRKIVALDACFRFIGLWRSNQTVDPSLHPNGAYMIDEQSGYGQYILEHADEADVSHSVYLVDELV